LISSQLNELRNFIPDRNEILGFSLILMLVFSLFHAGYPQTVEAQTSGSCMNQALTIYRASGNEPANPPSNAIDNNLNTIWSNNALGSWIQVYAGSGKVICSVDIAWYRGNIRQYNFDISIWDPNGQKWIIVFSGTSSGITTGPERYNFADVNGAFVMVRVHGNTENNQAAIAEIDVNGYTESIGSGPTVKDSNLKAQTIATGLSSPTSMAFVGLNDILVLEKNTGMVKRVKDGIILSPPLLDVNVATESERGMLGIDVVKISSTQHYIFLYYSKADSACTL
jgi:F5/8 type C domain/Glucose / Sorbosone dehydrogenase